MIKKLIVLCAMLMAASVVCHAVPTGLNIMPTAEVLGFGQQSFYFESDGSGKLFVPRGDSLAGTQTGFVMGIEGGIDTAGGDTIYNLKWRFIPEGTFMPALAVGAQNIAGNEGTQYYAVMTKNFLPKGMLQISGGAIRVEDNELTMVGAGSKLGPIRVMIDRVNGNEAFDCTAYGASLDLGGFLIGGTQYDYDNGPDERTFSISYTIQAF